MRPPFQRRHKAAVIALSAVALAASLPAGFAAAGTQEAGVRIGRAVQLRLPPDAGKGVSSELLAVDCVSRGWCLAGGGYSGRNYRSYAMVAAESGGRWGRAREVRMPANSYQAVITSVDCTGAESCVAVGDYSARRAAFGFSVTESGGRWAPAKVIQPPAGGGYLELASVSCVAPGNCAAVGTYQQGQDYQPVTAAESRGVWSRARELRLPSHGSVGELSSVSCLRRGFCVAVGDYDFNISGFGVMAAVESGGKWQRARAIQLPAGAVSGPYSPDLSSLSCTGTGSCRAVGSYENNAHHEVPMAAIEFRRRWARARAVNVRPANASRSQDATFRSVSCAEAGPCLGLGSYHVKSGGPETMFVTLARGRRASAGELPLPPNAKAGGWFNARIGFVGAVDCAPAGTCAAVGAYKPVSGLFQAWAVAGVTNS